MSVFLYLPKLVPSKINKATIYLYKNLLQDLNIEDLVFLWSNIPEPPAYGVYISMIHDITWLAFHITISLTEGGRLKDTKWWSWNHPLNTFTDNILSKSTLMKYQCHIFPSTDNPVTMTKWPNTMNYALHSKF